MEKVEFVPRVYNRTEFQKVVDSGFKEFGKPVEEQQKSVDQFFKDYEELFYEIPATGETNSHQYLVEKSSAFYKPEQQTEDIQPLLTEITQLRDQVIADQETILGLQRQLAEYRAAGN